MTFNGGQLVFLSVAQLVSNTIANPGSSVMIIRQLSARASAALSFL